MFPFIAAQFNARSCWNKLAFWSIKQSCNLHFVLFFLLITSAVRSLLIHYCGNGNTETAAWVTVEDATLLTRYSRTLWVSQEITLLEGNAVLLMGSFRSTEACEQAPELFNRGWVKRPEHRGTGFVGNWAGITLQQPDFLKHPRITPCKYVSASACDPVHTVTAWRRYRSAKLPLNTSALHWEPESQNLPYPWCWKWQSSNETRGQSLWQSQLRIMAKCWKSSGNRDLCQILAHNLNPSPPDLLQCKRKAKPQNADFSRGWTSDKNVFIAACQFCQPPQ